VRDCLIEDNLIKVKLIMNLLFILGLLLVMLYVPLLFYYLWMKIVAKKAWGIIIHENYQPKVSLIIPTYNEALVISRKLENVQNINYPKEKLQVILVDSASTDGTLVVCKDWLEKNNFRFSIKLLSEKQRLGKSHALNTALKFSDGEIVATSDADAFWETDALARAVRYFADPSIGAVTGREVLMNLEKNVHTMSEGCYRNFYYTLRLGESKMDSILIFDGSLALYRKSVLEKFEDRAGYSDDIGSAIKLLSKGYRCIFVPEAVFYDATAYSLSSRLMLKSRRAQHLIAGVIEALKLKIRRRLVLASKIIIYNFYIHVISPMIFMVTVCVGILALFLHFSILWVLIPIALLLLIFRKSRIFMVSYLTSYFTLIVGLVNHLTGRKATVWRKIEKT